MLVPFQRVGPNPGERRREGVDDKKLPVTLAEADAGKVHGGTLSWYDESERH